MTQPMSPQELRFDEQFGPLQLLAGKIFDEHLQDMDVDKRLITIAILLGVTTAIDSDDMPTVEANFDSLMGIAHGYAETVLLAKAEGITTN